MTPENQRMKRLLFQRLALVKDAWGVLKLMSYKQTLQGGSPGLITQREILRSVEDIVKDAPEANEIFFTGRMEWTGVMGKPNKLGDVCLIYSTIPEISPPKILGKDPFKKIWAETRWASRRVTPVKFIHFQQRTVV